MKKAFIITFDTISDPKIALAFNEAITSNFISKKATGNSIIIVAGPEHDAKTVFDLLSSQLGKEVSFLVINLDGFYGALNDGVFDWYKTQFPQRIYYSD